MRKKILIVKGKAGLGNRSLAFLTGVVYARLTGRELLVDWSDNLYSQNGVNSFHHFFTSPAVDSAKEVPCDAKSIAPTAWKGNLVRSVDGMIEKFGPRPHNTIKYREEYSIDFLKLDYTEDVLVMFSYIFNWRQLEAHLKNGPREWQGLGRKELTKKLLSDNLFLHKDIVRRVEEFKKDNFSKPMIGVHIRYTDNQGDQFNRSKLPSLDRYPAIIEKLLKEVPGAGIFLATDNEEILKSYREKYPNVIATDKWFPGRKGKRLHGHGACPDRIQNGVEALVDMHLLAECDYLVFSSKPTFAQVARMRSKANESKIFDVELAAREGSNPLVARDATPLGVE